MRQTEYLWITLFIGLWCVSCIRNFEPDILAEDAKRYVVSGQIAAGDSLQKVNVSITSPISAPAFLPIVDCDVSIYDDDGHQFQMTYAGQGDYSGVIDPSFLQVGAAFKVEVRTPQGEMLVSDFDTLTSVAGIDSVYYRRKDKELNEPGQFIPGIQFYLDVTGSETDSKYYRWELTETWEYHAVYPLQWYYDGVVHHVTPPDYSRNVCWSTKRLPNIFTLTTSTLDVNHYELFPLHFVANTTSRLSYGYSLLARQFSLSEKAFRYWEDLRINSNPEGGLYEKQPIAVRGNIHNVTDPDNIVLGYFGASSVVSQRIFVKSIPDLPLKYPNYCDAETLRFGLHEIKPIDYPAYLYGTEETYFPIVLDKVCVNCTLLGGSIVKPAFWPF